jgi:hypothetical protein
MIGSPIIQAMPEKAGFQQIDTIQIRRKLFSSLLTPNCHDLKGFLDDRDAGTTFIRLFQCGKTENQFKIAVVKQLLLCLESPDSDHLFVVPKENMLVHIMHEWRSNLNDLGLVHGASLSKLQIGFRGEHGRPTTILLGALDQTYRLRGLELASAVLYTAGDFYCRFAQSHELQQICSRIRVGSCPQVAVVARRP